MRCSNWNCQYRSFGGYCKVSACVFHNRDALRVVNENEVLIFPHTIAGITFENKEELINWVEYWKKCIDGYR